MKDQRFATVDEFAELIRVTPSKVYEMTGFRDFPLMRVGRKISIEVEPALNYIKNNNMTVSVKRPPRKRRPLLYINSREIE